MMTQNEQLQVTTALSTMFAGVTAMAALGVTSTRTATMVLIPLGFTMAVVNLATYACHECFRLYTLFMRCATTGAERCWVDGCKGQVTQCWTSRHVDTVGMSKLSTHPKQWLAQLPKRTPRALSTVMCCRKHPIECLYVSKCGRMLNEEASRKEPCYAVAVHVMTMCGPHGQAVDYPTTD
jgi:hypothetical protein